MQKYDLRELTEERVGAADDVMSQAGTHGSYQASNAYPQLASFRKLIRMGKCTHFCFDHTPLFIPFVEIKIGIGGRIV